MDASLQHCSYSVRPSHPPESEGTRPELSLGRWGLVPSWAKDSSAAARMINARSETADTKPAFRDALKFRRCLIPADGFYEWQKNGRAKQPYCFEVREASCSRLREYGRVEETKWKSARDLLDSDHYPECSDRSHPRPNARHPRPGDLRLVARSRDGECGRRPNY